MAVAVRIGLRRNDDAVIGTLTTATVALAVTLLIGAAPTVDHGLDLAELWTFVLAGAIAPGLSQLLFTHAVRDAGAALASVLMGAAPLFAVLIALVCRHDPVRGARSVAAGLTVPGALAAGGGRVADARF